MKMLNLCSFYLLATFTLSFTLDTQPTNHEKNILLFNAVQNKDIQKAQTLLKSGAHPDETVDLRSSTPLHVAIESQNYKLVNLLLEYTKNINIKSNDSCAAAPLHIAALKGNIKILKKLLKYGAEVNVTDAFQGTPLHYAIDKINPTDTEKSIKILLKNNANPLLKNDAGKTPIDYARNNGQYSIASLLEEAALHQKK